MLKIILFNFVFFIYAQTVFSQVSFLGSLNPDATFLSYHELKNHIIHHSFHKNAYLSLGESHLEHESASLINWNLMKVYSSKNPQRTIFCVEEMEHFLKDYTDKIKKESRKLKVMKGNTYEKTEFSQCLENKNLNYITYSGFFHQYPFARLFQLEFPQTPVIFRDDNNIVDQISSRTPLLVTQIELEWLEMTATKAIIENIRDVKQFRLEVSSLDSLITKIKNKMEVVIKTDSIFTQKSAVVIKSEEFGVSPKIGESYFLITNLNYRNGERPVRALNALLELSDEKLKGFWDRLDQSRYGFGAAFTTPLSNGELGRISYPGFDQIFEGGSLFIEIINERDYVLMVIPRLSSKFSCLDKLTQLPRDCF